MAADVYDPLDGAISASKAAPDADWDPCSPGSAGKSALAAVDAHLLLDRRISIERLHAHRTNCPDSDMDDLKWVAARVDQRRLIGPDISSLSGEHAAGSIECADSRQQVSIHRRERGFPAEPGEHAIPVGIRRGL